MYPLMTDLIHSLECLQCSSMLLLIAVEQSFSLQYIVPFVNEILFFLILSTADGHLSSFQVWVPMNNIFVNTLIPFKWIPVVDVNEFLLSRYLGVEMLFGLVGIYLSW